MFWIVFEWILTTNVFKPLFKRVTNRTDKSNREQVNQMTKNRLWNESNGTQFNKSNSKKVNESECANLQTMQTLEIKV